MIINHYFRKMITIVLIYKYNHKGMMLSFILNNNNNTNVSVYEIIQHFTAHAKYMYNGHVTGMHDCTYVCPGEYVHARCMH